MCMVYKHTHMCVCLLYTSTELIFLFEGILTSFLYSLAVSVFERQPVRITLKAANKLSIYFALTTVISR